MDIESLNKDLMDLVLKKNALASTGYDDPAYDDLEEEVHDLEDSILENYGNYLEDALHLVHDEYCPDNDVLLPIAYLANEYIMNGKRPDGTPSFEVSMKEGVIVEVDDYPGKLSRLVLVPNPVRLILNIGQEKQEEVWRAK